jgi:two-component system, LytTR family, response regulator
MNRYRLILADDEKMAREGLQLLLAKDDSIEVMQICANGIDAIQAIEKHRPEIVLLDIQMPEVNGFEVLRSLTPPLPQVIFITAYDQYAIKAFENNALDYLLKPFTDERFFKSLERAKEQIRQKAEGETSKKVLDLLSLLKSDDADKFIAGESIAVLKKLVVKVSGKIIMIPWSDITHIEADDYVVRVNYGGKTAVVREALKNFEQQLPNSQFLRVHKSFIVNLDKIAEIETGTGGGLTLKLSDKVLIPVSKNYRDAVATRLRL